MKLSERETLYITLKKKARWLISRNRKGDRTRACNGIGRPLVRWWICLPSCRGSGHTDICQHPSSVDSNRQNVSYVNCVPIRLLKMTPHQNLKSIHILVSVLFYVSTWKLLSPIFNLGVDTTALLSVRKSTCTYALCYKYKTVQQPHPHQK